MNSTSPSSPGGSTSRRNHIHAAVALLYTAVALTVLEYWFFPPTLEGRLQGYQNGAQVAPSLRAGVIWASATSAAFLVVPAIIVLVGHREGLTSIGYRWSRLFRHLWIYLGLFGVMLPVLWWVSHRNDFLQTYPFVKEATQDLGTFIRWEVAYLLSFVALESFFRGYLLFTLEKCMGWLSAFVMAVPYCMIHYHKPPLEAFGAVIAGVFLGGLALRYRSWYGGALLHGLVALTMDSLAAHRAGLFW